MKTRVWRIIRFPRDSLQFRVAFSLALFVAVAISAMMLALFAVYGDIQNNLLNSVTSHEMAELLDEYPDDGAAAIPHSANLIGYVIHPNERDQLPAALRELGSRASGLTRSIDDHIYRVSTHPIGDKQAYILYDVTKIKGRESTLKIVASLAALLIMVLAIPLGIWIARISLKPINALADQVAGLDPSRHPANLGQRFESHEVGVIARAFDRFMGRLEDFVERERSFTADASHELRTPLAVIQGAVEILQQDARLAGNAPLSRIDRATHQMAELIESLLFLARDTEADDMDVPVCRVDRVINELVDAYRPLMNGKNIKIGTLEAYALRVPRIAMVIVLGNLLRNALHHGGDEIRISLIGGRITLIDNGEGMNSHVLHHAFERGYHSSTSTGHGLGLYLAKRVADRYHWQIRLTSEPRAGMRAELSLG